MFHEELGSLFDTTFNFSVTGFGWHEMATLTTVVKFDSIDIDTFTDQFAV